MSYGRAAVAFTIAAIILISGLYVRFAFTAPNPAATVMEEDLAPYYKSLKSTSLGIAPHTSKVQTFEGKANQKVSLTANMAEEKQGISQSSDSLVKTIINVTDAKGKELVYDENLGHTYSIEPVRIENSGPVTVAMTNQGDNLIQVSMYLRESAPRATGFTDNGTQNFSNWLILVSMPVFGLGAWLLFSDRKRRGAD